MVFQEIQKFRQWWLWSIILIMPFVIFFISFFETKMLQIESSFIFLIFAPFIWYFLILKLKTQIDEKGITITFKPFLLNHKNIQFEDIKEAQILNYKPLSECGGWGVRWYKSGLAYTVSGNFGIELRLKNNEVILIGTQQPNEFYSAIKKSMPETRSL